MSKRVSEGPKRALVTGAGARLGKAMAEALGEDGWAVAVHYRGSRAGAEATAETIRASGGRAELVQADLSDEEQTATLERAAHEALGGPLTLLVNSASTFEDDSALEHSPKNWDFHMGPNLRAPILLAQHFARALPEDEAGLIEHLDIDGQRRWFNRAPSNLFRVSAAAAARRSPAIRPPAPGPFEVVTPHHLEVLERAQADAASSVAPRRVRVTQSLTVKADAVPAGDRFALSGITWNVGVRRYALLRKSKARKP